MEQQMDNPSETSPYASMAQSAIKEGMKAAADSAALKRKNQHEVTMKAMNDNSAMDFASTAMRTNIDSSLYKLQLTSLPDLGSLGSSSGPDYASINNLFKKESQGEKD